ncbi:antitoxin Xre/MbcA/ParS toxin-binding domain-containing protein [Mycolicibacterium sp. CBM1]
MLEVLLVDSSKVDEVEQTLRAKGIDIVALRGAGAADGGAATADRRRLRDTVAAVVGQADDAELDRLRSAVVAGPDDGLDERFWGPAPESEVASHAVFDDLADQFAARRALAAQSMSRDQVAELLGVAPQSITTKLAARKLVGFKAGREWRLPVWQFDPDNPSGVLPGLDALQEVFPGGVVSLSRWMQRDNPEFGGRTPRSEIARSGNAAAVIAAARALTAAAW